MKDITPYSLFESEDPGSEDQIDPQKQEQPEFTGYITVFQLARIQSTPGTSFNLGGKYIHIVHNLWEVIENLFTKTEYELKKLDWQSHFWEFMTDPIDAIPKFIDSKTTDIKCLSFKIFSGFTPARQDNNFVRLSSDNPYSEIFALSLYLKNAEQKLKDDISSLTSRIREDFKNEEELKKLLLANPTLLYLLDSRPEDKQRLIKELGIKDLSKIGKGLNLGII